MNPGSKRSLRMTAMKSDSQFHKKVRENKRYSENIYMYHVPTSRQNEPFNPIDAFRCILAFSGSVINLLAFVNN